MQTNDIRHILRVVLTTDFSDRRIAKICGYAPNTIGRYRRISKLKKWSWDLVSAMGDIELQCHMAGKKSKTKDAVVPDWGWVYEQKSKHKAILKELWYSYRHQAGKENSYSYSQFTHFYRQYRKSTCKSMRFSYSPAEVAFVDFCGTTMSYSDIDVGEVKVQVLIFSLGYSRHIFCVALPDQTIESWIEGHVRAFNFWGGVPSTLVPDNLKAAVTAVVDRIPVIQREYLELSEFYNCVIVPARVYKPKDKALAEESVKHITNWIIRPLNRRKFFSLSEINTAILGRLKGVNSRPLREYEGSRESRLVETEKPALIPLPDQPYEFGRWVGPMTVNPDSHVKVSDHYYSVPSEYVSKKVEARVNSRVVGIYFDHKRVAIHSRSTEKGGTTTILDHYEKNYREYLKYDFDYYVEWASAIGEYSLSVVKSQFHRRIDNFNFAKKTCSQLKSLSEKYDDDRFEAACKMAVDISTPTVTQVASNLSTRMSGFDSSEFLTKKIPMHRNIRGADYFKSEGPEHDE